MSLGAANTTIKTEGDRSVSLRVNTSAYGTAKTRVWGKQRVSGNMLWYGDFVSIPHTSSTSSRSGKGGGGVTSQTTSYTYQSGFVIGLCVGPISGVGTVWRAKDVTTIQDLGLTLKTGEQGQEAWAHLVSNYPDKAVSYSGIAYAAASAFDLGSSPNQPNLSFEVFGERLIAGGNDAKPGDVIYDIVSDPLEGVGLPTSVLANRDDYALWCHEMGLVVSVAATSQNASRDILAKILKATMSEAIWSNGQIKCIPYGDTPVGAWSPVTIADYDLSEGDFLSPPNEIRKQPADAINRVTLNYTSRANDYNTASITRDDLSAVTQYGVRPETLDLPCITLDTVAAAVCDFWKDRGLYIRNTWECEVDERFCLIEPMDLLTITFAPKGLSKVPVRVQEVTDDGQGKIRLLVEEWPFGLLTNTAVPTQQTVSYTPELNIPPGASNTPVIFEAPNVMTAPNLEVWIGTSGGENWGGANVWASDDGNSYRQIGIINAPARHGVISSPLPTGSDPDTSHTLNVDIFASGGTLTGGTQADADNGNTLCWVDGELISYQNATLTSSGRYALTHLRRGQKGTPIGDHTAGTKFIRLDDAVFRCVVPRERIGSVVWVKLQSFNKYGKSAEYLDQVIAYQHTITGNKPLGLTSLSATGGLFEINVSWTTSPEAVGIDFVEIWGATVNNTSSAVHLTSQKKGVLSWSHTGIHVGQGWYYWGRVIDTSGNVSDPFPLGSTAGIHATPNSDPSSLLDQLNGALGLQQLSNELAQPIALIGSVGTQLDWLSKDQDLILKAQNVLSDIGGVDSSAKVLTETTARQTSEEAFASRLDTVQAAVSDSVALITQEATTRATANSATASRIDGLVSLVSGNSAAIVTEQQSRAYGDSANAGQISQVQARLDTGDYAAVKQSAATSANKFGVIEAKYVLQADVNGVVASQLLTSDGKKSTIGFLCNEFFIAKPDKSGPKQVFVVGTVNGVTAVGIAGDVIVDGTLLVSSFSSSTSNQTYWHFGTTQIASALIGAYHSTSNASYIPLGAEHLGGGPAFAARSFGGRAVWGIAGNSGCEGTLGHDATQSGGYFITAGAAVYLKAATGSYAAYLGGAAGPFTGAHDGMILKSVQIEPGDIVVDVKPIAKKSISDTITEVAISSSQNQTAAVGVFVGFDPTHVPEALSMLVPVDEENAEMGVMPSVAYEFRDMWDTHNLMAFNALGEGQINVCGEGGDLSVGDLVVTSSVPGKGMRQSDDIIRSYTVAKCRESVSFDSPTQVKQVACIYLCG